MLPVRSEFIVASLFTLQDDCLLLENYWADFDAVSHGNISVLVL